MKFANFLNSVKEDLSGVRNNNSDINEAFRTDAEGIKEIYKKDEELTKKIRPFWKRRDEIEKEKSSLMYRIAGITNNLMAFEEKGQKNTQMEKTYEKLWKEYEALEAELKKLLPQYNELSAEKERLRKLTSKMIVRNAERLGLPILQYVGDNNLYR